MNIDPKTVIIINVLGCLLMSLGLWVVSLAYFKRDRYVKEWAIATLFQALGWMIVGALRGILPDWISIGFGNSLLLFSLFFYYNIILRFFEKEPKWASSIIFVITEFILLMLIFYSDLNQKFRVSVLSFFSAYALLLSAYEIFYASKDNKINSRFTGFFFGSCGLYLIVRGMYYSFWEIPSEQVTFGSGVAQDITYLFFYMTSAMLSFGFLLMCVDRYANELVESEKKYRLIAENSKDVIWLYNVELNQYRYVSPSIQQLTGFPPSDFLKLKLNDSFRKSSYDKISEIITRFLKSNSEQKFQDSFIGEFEQICKNGTSVVIETNFVFQKNHSNHIEILGVSRDINHRKEAEIEIQKILAQLKTLNNTKDKFLSIIAHDLKGPLGGIHSYAQLILEEYESSSKDKLKKEIEVISSTSSEVFNLLENLLTWARSQTGEVPYAPEEISLFPLVETILQIFFTSATNKGVRLENQIPIDIVVYADRAMIGTVLRNLVSNALKYSQVGGIVKIKSKQTIGSCEISVRDTGSGIPENIKSKLFHIDSKQSSIPGTMGERGTGLGLILCKEFMDRHQGKIWVESRYGEGSEFFISLPKREYKS